MIIRQILIFFLANGANASFLDGLADNMARISFTDRILGEQPSGLKVPEPRLSLDEIFEQGNRLMENISSYGTEAAVKKIECKLISMLTSGVVLHDITPIVSSFEIDAKELVLAAVKVEAHNLLKLLQGVYIWRDANQFHWFQALAYHSPWYDENLWKDTKNFPMNWEDNLLAVCKVDNGHLMTAIINGEVPSKIALKKFSDELLVLCVEHDAVKVFEAAKFDPTLLEKYLKILSDNSSAKLLHLYQAHTKLTHLHLEQFSFPKKLPVGVDDFKFLMSHGHDCFPMNRFIRQFCEKGRLDLLICVRELNPKLVPSQLDREIAAEKGWLEIIQWILCEELLERDDNYVLAVLAGILASNHHFRALDWLISTKEVDNDVLLRYLVHHGALDALKWIDDREPILECKSTWAIWAAAQCHLPVLIWLYERFKVLPPASSLQNATIEMLEWIKEKDSTLINSNLVFYGRNNFRLLEWVFKNAENPQSLFEKNICVLGKRLGSMRAMTWLYKKAGICLSDMGWAYQTGDLEAVQWALKNCHIFPTEQNISLAAKGGHVKIIRWIHELYPEHLHIPRALKAAIESGNLEIANYLLPISNPENKLVDLSLIELCESGRLDALMWAHARDYVPTPICLEVAISKGHFHVMEWSQKIIPRIQPLPNLGSRLINDGLEDSYKWLLENHPKGCLMEEEITVAFTIGNLRIVKAILNKDPALVRVLHKLEVTALNYHIKQWERINNI